MIVTNVPDTRRCAHWAFICEASSCRWDGAPAVRDALGAAAQDRAEGDVAVVRTGCLGLCGAGPAMVTYPAGDVYLRVQPGDAPELVAALAEGGSLSRRRVRAPQWYRDRMLDRLRYYVELLRRRSTPTGQAT